MSQIHHEVTFAASPEKVYTALMDPKQHAAFTGASAEVSPEAGGTFSCHDGKVLGRNVELVPNRRIVQAWRPANWPEGIYSIARFELHREGTGTRLVFDQDGIPEDSIAHLDGGWKQMYWAPLRTFLEK